MLPAFEPDGIGREMADVRHRIVNGTLVSLAIVSPLMALASFARWPSTGFQPNMVVHSVVALVFVLAALFRKRLAFRTSALLVVLMFWVLAVAALLFNGIVAGNGFLTLLAACVWAAALMGWMAGAVSFGMGIVLIVAVGTAAGTGLLAYPHASAATTALGWWFNSLARYALFGVLLLVTVTTLHSALVRHATGLMRRTEELRQARDDLQAEVVVRQKAEAEARAGEVRFRTLSEVASEGIILAKEGKVQDVNQALVNLLGRSRQELSGLPVEKCLGMQRDDEVLVRMLRKPGGRPHEFELPGSGAEPLVAQVEVKAVGDGMQVVVAVRDLSKMRRDEETRRKLEDQLRTAQKMQALGTLAGGVAHDFNNVLAAIMGLTESALEDVEGRPGTEVKLEQIHQACRRSKDLVRQILSFSKAKPEELVPIGLQGVVQEALSLLRPSTPPGVKVNQRFESDLPPVMADPSRIHQIVMNLGTNAYHAMAGRGGELNVELSAVGVTPEEAGRNIHLRPGRHVQLKVTDTGHGMDAATMARIFEPYFTTKGEGVGTGLGLSVVHGIVEAHQGAILVESEPGVGTTFRILFPALDQQTVAQERPATDALAGVERVLLVDDEEVITELNTEALQRLGYRVTATNDAHAALQLFTSNPQAFDAIVTDLVMPRMSGADLVQHIRRIRTDIPIILCTGSSEMMPYGTTAGHTCTLLKPMTGKDVARTIRECMLGRAKD